MSWEIVDGNVPDVDPLARISSAIDARRGSADPVEVVAFTVMPGPQLVNAVPLARALKARYPHDADRVGRQFPEPLSGAGAQRARTSTGSCAARASRRSSSCSTSSTGDRDPKTVAGLSFRERRRHALATAPERIWVGPDELPAPPYHKIDVADYLRPTYLGRRSGVYQASIGCPYGCKFCGVISVFGSRERLQAPARTAEHLEFLVREHGMDSVHFYDNNFFVKEAHARELAERIDAARASLVVRGARRRADALLRRHLAAAPARRARRWCSAAPSRGRTKCCRR